MRILRVLISTLALLTCICLADDSAREVQPRAQNGLDQSLGLRINPDGKIFGKPLSGWPKLRSAVPDTNLRNRKTNKRTINTDATCFSMRTYMVEREDPGSDTVTPKGYSTCQPSSSFDLRDAIAPVETKP
jgi:hypothetical protein